MQDISLDKALRQFEIIEANLEKIKKNFARLDALESASGNTGYTFDDCSRAIQSVWQALPKIDGWKPDLVIYDPNERTLMRFDAREIAEPHAIFATEEEIERAEKSVEEYAHQVKLKRLELTRKRILHLAQLADDAVLNVEAKLELDGAEYSDEFVALDDAISEIDALLGSTFPRPPRWTDLRRHISFWQSGDLFDIVNYDWPAVYPVLTEQLYTEDEPIEVSLEDLGSISINSEDKPVTTALNWANLDDDGFERLIFNLISEEQGYKNPKWLMRTNAPDKGRDLSVERSHEDPLSGTIQQRVIIQCKNWRSRSVSVDEVAKLKIQIKLWEPPVVDLVVIATSGRFTADAVTAIEQQNQSGTAPRIDMWPESHLEMLLARRPALLALFRLK